MTSNIISAVRSIRLVFRNPNYIILAIILAVIITLVIFFISTLILNYEFLAYVFASGAFDFEDKIEIFWSLLVSVGNNFLFSSKVIIISLAILLAVDISLSIFYFKRQMAIRSEVGVGIFGLLVGFLGAGCSACGSIILSSFLGFTTAAILIGFLPLNGLEFGIIGILLLLFSIYLIASRIENSAVCETL